MIISPKAVALVGKLGHGKTRLLNTLTGTSFPSNMGARSCTEQIQYGYSRNNEILVVDTPGFYSSDDIAKHIAAQKIALEELELSGIYIVIKNDRADLVAQAANKIMDFVGDDNLRIIVTHADGVSSEDGFDQDALASALSGLLNIPVEHIAIVGKKTPAVDIENFISATLHTPKRFTISQEQVASISSLCVANRRFNKMIDQIYSKISAASKACSEVIAENGRTCYETDVAIVTTQSATQAMVAKDKEEIFCCVEGQELITTEDKNVIYGKAGLALSLRLKAFVDSTNKLLSWDVTDTVDPRNDYRKCNHCGAIFNKTEGCDGETVCGALPSSVKRPRPRMLLAEFLIEDGVWTVQYLWKGNVVLIQYILTELRKFYRIWDYARDGDQEGFHQKRSDAVFESGCGNIVFWSTMLPVDPALVQMLGTVELHHPGPLEKISKAEFDERLKHHEELNKNILRGVAP